VPVIPIDHNLYGKIPCDTVKGLADIEIYCLQRGTYDKVN